jgi:uncharacterized protein (TIGR02444 family)
MNIDLLNADLSLWDFASAFYAKPKVQSACLTLQDQYGVNVPLLLCCCWASMRYGILPLPLSKDLQQYTEAYSNLAIEPLRLLRTTMKNSHDAQWPTTVNEWQDLRESVKKIEIASECLLLSGLERLIIAKVAKPLIVSQQEKVQLNCIANIAVCFNELDVNRGTAKTAIELIVNVIGAQKHQ